MSVDEAFKWCVVAITACIAAASVVGLFVLIREVWRDL